MSQSHSMGFKRFELKREHIAPYILHMHKREVKQDFGSIFNPSDFFKLLMTSKVGYQLSLIAAV